MSAATGFHHYTRYTPVGKKRLLLRAFENLAVDCAGVRIDEMELEDARGQIDGNDRGCHLILLAGRTAEPAMSHIPEARLRRRTDH